MNFVCIWKWLKCYKNQYYLIYIFFYFFWIIYFIPMLFLYKAASRSQNVWLKETFIIAQQKMLKNLKMYLIVRSIVHLFTNISLCYASYCIGIEKSNMYATVSYRFDFWLDSKSPWMDRTQAVKHTVFISQLADHRHHIF